MWTRKYISKLIRRSAHEDMLGKSLTMVNDNMLWINGYEYALFCDDKTCMNARELLHENGLLFDEVAGQRAAQLAPPARVSQMRQFIWNGANIEAFVHRDDASEIFCLGTPNAYVYGLHMGYPQTVGMIARRAKYSLADVVQFREFKYLDLKQLRDFYLKDV